MDASSRPWSLAARLSQFRPRRPQPHRRIRPAGLALALLALAVVGAWLAPRPDVRAFQQRQRGLAACSDALSVQGLAGHHLDGVRLLPSSVIQTGAQLRADYAARDHGSGGWNSGPLLTVHCQVMAGQAHLHVTVLDR